MPLVSHWDSVGKKMVSRPGHFPPVRTWLPSQTIALFAVLKRYPVMYPLREKRFNP